MANEKNLKPFTSDQSREEAVKNGRKGGVESGKARRKKKAARERINEVLELSAINSSAEAKKALHQLGMNEDGTNYDVLIASIVAGAIRGLPGYARMVLDLIGETGEEKRAKRADIRDEKRLKMEIEDHAATKDVITEDDGFLEALSGYVDNSDWSDDGED